MYTMTSKNIDPGHATLAAAQSYCERNWKLLAVWGVTNGVCDCGKHDCTSPGKHPRYRNWPDRASSSMEGAQWWLTQTNFNIAVATGSGSGIFVIDEDGPEGELSLNELQAKYGALPATLTAKTGRGWHLYFRHPGGRVKSNAGMLGNKLDVRGDGGYVLVPPSMHISGVRYEWVDAEAEISEAPAWLVARVCGEGPAQGRAKEPVDTEVIGEGMRNDTLFRAACGMRGEGLEANEIQAELLTLNESCNPPLELAEVKTIAINAAKYSPGRGRKITAITGDEGGLKWMPLDIPAWKRNEYVFAMKDYQVGWYIWLMIECWDRGGYLPSDPALLSKLARAASPKRFYKEFVTVLAEFELTEDKSELVHPALRAEYESRAQKVDKKRHAAKVRWETARAAAEPRVTANGEQSRAS
jgi:uncharacterized protein YdaU (DUF1376 family)